MFPPIGLGLTRAGHVPSPAEAAALSVLEIGHIRSDLRLRDGGAMASATTAVAAAATFNCGLELAVFFGTSSEAELDRFTFAVHTAAGRLRRVLVFTEDEPVTTPGTLDAARAAIGPGIPLFGGTNLNFAELNRSRPLAGSADGFAFSANPQVHMDDDQTLIENASTFADILSSARLFLGDSPVAVTPITLRGRFNPDLPGLGTSGPGGPPEPDHRQGSLLCAGFTLMALKSLACGGASSATFFETTGDSGVVASADPHSSAATPLLALPALARYPVFEVLAIAGRWTSRPALAVTSSAPLFAEAAGCVIDGVLELLVANLTASELTVSVDGLPREPALLSKLDSDSAERAWAFGRASLFSQPSEVRNRPLVVALGPYALCLLRAPAPAIEPDD